MSKISQYPILKLIPIIAIGLFFISYLISAFHYPGGSDVHPYRKGFDVINNYWCNLLSSEAINGETNPSRPFAITGMISLCVGMATFFTQFAKAFIKNQFWKQATILGGISSMFVATFLFTSLHDLLIIISSVLGIFPVIGLCFGLSSSSLKAYNRGGLICVVLIGLNNLIYYSENMIEILPLLQKITFVFVLSWVILLNLKILSYDKKTKLTSS